MKRRNLITFAGKSILLASIMNGCSQRETTKNSRHLVETPEKRANYLAKMLKVICTDLGPHPVGSPEFNKAVEIIKKEMELSLPIVKLDPFPIERWILVNEPEFYVGDKKVEAYPTYGSKGTEVNGTIGLLKKSEKDRIPYFVVNESSGKTIAYVVIAPKDKAVARGYGMYDNSPNIMPMFCVGIPDVPILEAALQNRIPVRLKAQVDFIPNTPTTNVVGTLPGKSTDEIVIFAHLDTVYISPGANDNTASLVMVLMLAHSVSGTCPKKTLTFIATTGEECGYLGTKHYAEKRKNDGSLQNIKFIMNFDSVTWGPDMHIYSQDEEITSLLKAIDEELNINGTPNFRNTDGLGREARPFNEAGVQARGIVVDSVPIDEVNALTWHRPQDTPKYVSGEYVEISFQLFSEFLNRVQELL